MKENSILFSPITLGNLTLKNRIAMAPMTRTQAKNNIPTEDMIYYYAKRAKGGTALIISEGTFVNHEVANGNFNAPAFYGDALIMWKKLVDKVHASGAKIIPQLWHAGNTRKLGVTPNENMVSIGPMDEYIKGKQTVRAMSQNDIDEVIKAFTKAALDAKELNFDGIELLAAHGYLIDQFFWEKTNQRTDKYGGTFTNRLRFANELVKSTKKAVGKDFPVVFRFSQWKTIDYDAKIAKNEKELKELLLSLVEAGVDIFHVSEKRFWMPAFKESPLTLATLTKKITNKPVITVGNIGLDEDLETIKLVEKKLKDNEFDIVAVGRALLADANWVNKIKENRINEIIPFSKECLNKLD